MGRVRYTIIGGQLSDLEPITKVNFPGLPVERCLDAPRIAADGLHLRRKGRHLF